ncbi:MAG: pentapeptide repeat-containing protein [Cyanobacteria bacterium P01_C01_bin.120]
MADFDFNREYHMNMLKKRLRKLSLVNKSNFFNLSNSWILIYTKKLRRDCKELDSESFEDLSFREKLFSENSAYFLLLLFRSLVVIFTIRFFIFFVVSTGSDTFKRIVDFLSNIDLDRIEILGKTAWEWSELLFIPIIIGVLGFVFKNILYRQESGRRNLEILKSNIDQISSLIVSSDWSDFSQSSPQSEIDFQSNRVLTTIRARSLVAMRELDKKSLAIFIQFLSELNVIQGIPFENLDLSRVYLKNADLSRAQFKNVNFRNAIFENVNLRNSNLSGSDMLGSELRDVILDSANLEKVFFNFSYWRNVSAKDSNLSRVSLHHSRLRDVDFTRANLKNSRITLLYEFRRVTFEKSILCGAVFEAVSLKGMNFLGANLANANFYSVDLEDVDFSEADLSEANFVNSNVGEAKGLEETTGDYIIVEA